MRKQCLVKISLLLLSVSFSLTTALGSEKNMEEKVLSKAKEEVSTKVDYSRTFAIFVSSHRTGIESYYLVYFLDKKGLLKARASVIAYDDDSQARVTSVQLYPEGVDLDTTYFSQDNVRELFNNKQEAKMYNAMLVLPEEKYNADTLLPCWRVIDDKRRQWYVTLNGKIYREGQLDPEALIDAQVEKVIKAIKNRQSPKGPICEPVIPGNLPDSAGAVTPDSIK